MLNTGLLISEDPNGVLDRKHYTKLSGIIGWNLTWLAYQVLVHKHKQEIFNSFECLGAVNPILFSQLCLYHYDEISKDLNLGVQPIYHQIVVTFNLPPANQLTWLK